MKNKKSNESVPEILYIVYGSNLNLSQMKQRCPTARVIG
ncbi:MAG: gamma-glutamylcyclotransferase, partial [Sedimentibacter sp.]